MQTRSFKDTIKRFFMINALIPLTTLLFFFVILSIVNSRQLIINRTNTSNRELSSELGEVINDYEDFLNDYGGSPVIRDYFSARKNSPLVYESFYEFNNRSSVKSSLYLLDTEGNILLSSAVREIEPGGLQYLNDMIERLRRNQRSIRGEANTIRHESGITSSYVYAKEVKDAGVSQGYIFLLLYEEDFQRFIFDTNVNISVITDEYDTIIASTNTGVATFLNKFNPRDTSSGVELFSEEFYMQSVNIPSSNLTLHSLSTLRSQSQYLIWIFSFLMISSLIVLFILWKLSSNLSAKVTSPIDTIVHAIKKLQKGNMTAYVELQTGDEFEVLAMQYNIMLDRINMLISQNIELGERRKVSEIKQLEAQFNPHLIFNVLESLRYSIVIDQKQAESIIMALSRLLRYSIRQSTHEVPLREDLIYLEDFLSLHKLRFGSSMHYRINIQEEVLDITIPRLLLQPIVENAIKYGFTHQDQLCIEITGEIREDSVLIHIKDNGGGIDKAKFEEISKALKSPNINSDDLGIGILNVHRRIKLLYGEDYGLTLKNISSGLDVTIKLPYITKEDS